MKDAIIISGLSHVVIYDPGCVAKALPLRLLCAAGDIRMKSRVEGEKCNKYRYRIHFVFYSLAVEDSFYSSCGRVVGSFIKLSNSECG